MLQSVVAAVGLVTDADAALRRDVGLGVREALVLAAVGCCGVDGGRIGVIAARARVPVATASRVVDRLEAAGLVVRRAAEADGRVVLLSLTDEGWKAREQVMAVISQTGASAIQRGDGDVPDEVLMLGPTPNPPLEEPT